MTDSQSVLVKVNGNGAAQLNAANGVAGFEVETILRVPARAGNQGIAAAPEQTWLRVKGNGGQPTPWDAAHAMLDNAAHPFAAAGGAGQVVSAEPDLEQQWQYSASDPEKEIAVPGADRCSFLDQSEKGGCPKGPSVAWNLLSDFSGLKAARDAVGDNVMPIRVAHLDTGYDPQHATLPLKLLKDLQRNFRDKAFPNDASDRTPPEKSFMRNRGHGTATLCLLAGRQLDGQFAGWDGFADYIGGAPLAEVIPIRIADWVVRLTTSSMVQ